MRHHGRRTRTAAGGVIALVAFASLLSGCGVPQTTTTGSTAPTVAAPTTQSPTPTPTPTYPAASLALSVPDQSSDVDPTVPVTVTVSTGTLDTVTLTDENGGTIAGTITGSTWTTSRTLRPSATYTLTATAKSHDGKAVTETSTFTTLKPRITATYHLLYTDQTVGVGMPVVVQFDSAVATKEQRAALEKAITVTTTPVQEGSWGWLDNRQLMWRPKDYWQAGTHVEIHANIAGMQTGDGKYVGEDASATMDIGDSHITYVDIAAHTITVTSNGETVREMPTSTGKPGYDTRSGIKVIMSKEPSVVMDAATLGVSPDDPNYYKTTVTYAMRVTWTGEYLHNAPWSVGVQGKANVSHGCTHLSPTNAVWMYNFSLVGDVVSYSGNNKWMKPTEGIGVWTFSWEDWQKQSANA